MEIRVARALQVLRERPIPVVFAACLTTRIAAFLSFPAAPHTYFWDHADSLLRGGPFGVEGRASTYLEPVYPAENLFVANSQFSSDLLPAYDVDPDPGWSRTPTSTNAGGPHRR
jgi:hypothetical protein